jgi:hypothetical protein
MELFLKACISGIIVAAASEASRRSPLLGAVLVSLPLTSMLALAWLWRDTRDPAQVAALSTSIMWIVVPSLAFFALLPVLLVRMQWPFWGALLGASVAMAGAYLVYVRVLQRVGIEL